MDLWEALRLDPEHHRAVALVGGGGKTSTLYALARAAREREKSVVVTTTTHMMAHPAIFLTSDPDPENIRALLEQHGIVTLGQFHREDKMGGAGVLLDYKDAAGVVLIEADGARLHPLKVPREGEPVIPPGVDAVAAVAGMDSVGQPIASICHRIELVCALLDKDPSQRVEPEDVAVILASPQGGRKGVEEGMAFRCILNKADTPERRQAAEQIAGLLAERGIHAAITAYKEEERGGRDTFS